MLAPSTSSTALRLTELGIPFVDSTRDSYDRDRAIWNARIDRRPALIALPRTSSQISQLVLLAQSENLPLTVRGAGHGVLGTCVGDGALVIDLSRMKSVSVDPDNNTAVAEPGLTVAEFIHAIAAHDRIVTFGSHKDVGLAGFTLSAGIGLLMNRYGLLSDNLLSAEVVLADGSIAQASTTEHPDLLWAIRGGGGNFGIVTSLTYRVYPIEPTIAGALIYPIAQAEEGLRFYRDFTRDLPDSLSVFAAMTTAPSGAPVFVLLGYYTGPLDEGERLLAPLRSFGTPVVQTLAPIPPRGHARVPRRGRSLRQPLCLRHPLSSRSHRRDHHRARSLRHQPRSPTSVVVVYEFHGQARRATLEDSSFPTRDMPYSLGIYANWPTGATTLHI